MNQGNDGSNNVPPRSSDDSPALGQRVYDTARVQRTPQIAFIRDRLDQGLSPATVAGVAAIIAQMESQVQAPMLTISITSGFPGFQRSMTYQDGVWHGHDLTHHFTDDRAAISYSPANGGVHQTRSLQIPSCPPPPPPPPPASTPQTVVRARTSAPTVPNLPNQPMAEQAVISALQAVAINPNYVDFMRSMEQCWPELRRIALPTVTIRNENVTSTQTSQDAITIPHVNPQSEKPGHSRTVTVERSRSPSRSSQKGGGESRPASRKRNDPSPTKKSAQQPLTARDSPSSKPPTDKKISNEKATTSKTPNQTKSKVSEASVLPSPQPQPNATGEQQGLPQPPSTQSTTRESLAQRATPKPSTSRQPQTKQTVGYQGTPESQRTVKDIMGDYPGLKITNSGPTGTPLRKQAIQHPNKRTFTKQPTYLSPMQNTKGTLITKDSRRIWESAVIVSPEWLFEKNMCPPNDEEHAKLKKANVPVFMNRPIRPDHTPTNEPPWLGKAMNMLPNVEDNYLDALNIDLRGQFADRYFLNAGETFEVNPRYARDLEAQLPMPKERLQRARFALLIDSTFHKNIPIDNVLSDVMVFTLPLSRIPEMAEVLVTMFDPEMTGTFKEPPPRRVIISNVFDHMACEGLMAQIANVEIINPTPAQRTTVRNAALNVARAMEKAQNILKDKLNVPVLFVTPPGFCQWPPALQRFIYMVTEICKCREIDFAICAPNMRISSNDFRPSWLSYMGYVASVSKVLQSVEKTGNAQLTIDDAIYFDHGTRMGLLVFNNNGERRVPEHSTAECEAIRLNNWIERARSSGGKTCIKTDLAEVTAIMSKVPSDREVERDIPRVQFAQDLTIDQLSVGMRYIAAKLTSETQAEIQAFSSTYDAWYQRLQTTTVADIAKELGMSTDQFTICLGLGWSPDNIRVEFDLDEHWLIEISKIIGTMQVNELFALMLTFGQKRFVAGPMMILTDLVTECNLEWLFSYLVIARGNISGLTALAKLLQRKDAQDYPAHLERMTTSLYHWIYCSLVFASGLFVGVDKHQPLYDGRQLVTEVAGFLTPNQLADFTLAEVEDLVPVLAPVLTPIFGPTGILRYPTKHLRLAWETPTVSILTFLKNVKPYNYQQMLERGLFLLIPRMYTTIKNETQQDENLAGILKARTKKACPLPREYGPVNWYNSPLDHHGIPQRFNWSFAHLRKYVTECVQAMGGHTNQGYNFQMIKLPARYWRGPIGYARAKPISMVEKGFNEQYAYRDHYKLGVWMSRTLEERQGRLKGLIIPPQTMPVWNPEARVTMGSDMPAETCYHVMELLSDPLGPEWEASRQIIEHENRDNWSRACWLWGRPDLRPKLSAKQKRPIATRNRPLDLPHLFNASRLDVQIPTSTSTTSSANVSGSANAAQEHSPEVSTPVAAENGPSGSNTTPRTHETASAEPRPVLREGNVRRGSLSEPQPKADVSPRARHFSATQ